MAKQQAASKSTAVAPKASSAPVETGDNLPDYIRKGTARGSEGVGTADLIIPRLDIVQSLSPYRQKNDPKFVQGCEEGDLVNSVTLANYGDDVTVIPVIFRKEYLVWRDRKLAEQLKIGGGAGGFFGAYPTMELADGRAAEEGGKAKAIIVIDTPQNFCLLINKSGKAEEIVISMPRSKAKVARKWNSLIRMYEGDRFSRAYKIGTVFEKGQKGDFYNYDVALVGFPSKEVYMLAEKLYNDVTTGAMKVQADTSDGHPGGAIDDTEM
jgi:hypothetical protein